MSDESRKSALKAFGKTVPYSVGKIGTECFDAGWSARDAEIEKWKALSVQMYEDHKEMAEENEKLEARVEDLESVIRQFTEYDGADDDYLMHQEYFDAMKEALR